MNRKVPAYIRKLMKELKDGLTRIYGDQLKAVYIYGSYAREDARLYSDVDVMIVLNNYESYGKEIDRVASTLVNYKLPVDRTI